MLPLNLRTLTSLFVCLILLLSCNDNKQTIEEPSEPISFTNRFLSPNGTSVFIDNSILFAFGKSNFKLEDDNLYYLNFCQNTNTTHSAWRLKLSNSTFQSADNASHHIEFWVMLDNTEDEVLMDGEYEIAGSKLIDLPKGSFATSTYERITFDETLPQTTSTELDAIAGSLTIKHRGTAMDIYDVVFSVELENGERIEGDFQGKFGFHNLCN